jgi:hypothetical protein
MAAVSYVCFDSFKPSVTRLQLDESVGRSPYNIQKGKINCISFSSKVDRVIGTYSFCLLGHLWLLWMRCCITKVIALLSQTVEDYTLKGYFLL